MVYINSYTLQSLPQFCLQLQLQQQHMDGDDLNFSNVLMKTELNQFQIVEKTNKQINVAFNELTLDKLVFLP